MNDQLTSKVVHAWDGNFWIMPLSLQVILGLGNLNNLILTYLSEALNGSLDDYGVLSQKVVRTIFHTPHGYVV